MFGISAALTTPFRTDGTIDFDRLNNHINTLLSEGCSSVTFFGTTGEGASVASDTRLAAVRAAVDARISPDQLILCLHGAAVGDIVTQVNAALAMGVARFLLPPPCYFNDPTEDGLYQWFAAVVSQFDGTGAEFFLYHIPQVIGVALPIDVVKRLKAAYPEVVHGVKDSSGSFENTRELLKLSGLRILVGDERLLADAVKLGAAGAITGIGNLFAAQLNQVVASGADNPQINHLVDVVLGVPVTAAIKALVGYKYGDDSWRRTAPPLTAISDREYDALTRAFDQVDKV